MSNGVECQIVALGVEAGASLVQAMWYDKMRERSCERLDGD